MPQTNTARASADRPTRIASATNLLTGAAGFASRSSPGSDVAGGRKGRRLVLTAPG